MGDVAATILPRSAVKLALDAQGLYTGATGERLEVALGEWLDRAGYPRTVQRSGPEDVAFVGGAAAGGDVLWDIAQQHAARTAAGAYGGAAASAWPKDVPIPGAPPSRSTKLQGSGMRGLAAQLTFEQKAGLALLGLIGVAALAGAAGGLAVRAAPPAKDPAGTT